MAADPFGGLGQPIPATEPEADPFGGLGRPVQATADDPFGGLGQPAPGTAPTQPLVSGSGAEPEPASVPEQLARGVGNAVAGVVDPSGKLGLLPKDYYKRERGGWEMLSEIVTHFGAGRGLAVGGGALAGAVLGPAGAAAGATAGNFLYSLYQGVGREVSRSEAEGQDFNTLRAAANTALEFNPLVSEGNAVVKALGLASKSGSVARVAGQAAGQAATEYSYSGDKDTALATGAIGLLLAYPMFKGIRAVDPKLLPTQESFQATARTLGSETGSDVLKRTAAKVAANTAELDADDLGFQRFVTNAVTQPERDVRQAFAKLSESFTPERLESAWQGYKASSAFTESLEEVAHEKAKQLGGKVADLDVRKWKDSWKPLEFVSSRIDRAWGTNLEGKVQAVATAKEVFQVKAAKFYDEATRVDAAARKLGVSRTDIGKALDGQLERLKPDVQVKLTEAVLADRDGKGKVSVLDAWRRLWNEAREEIQTAGYDIGQITNYVPMRTLRGVDLAEAFRDQYTKLQQRALTGRTSILDLKGEDVDDFKTMAARVLRKSVDELTETDLTTAAKSALAQAKTTPAYTPSAVFERLGSVPDSYREYDVGKLFTGYINGNLKAVHFDTPLKDIQTHITAFKAAGMPQAAAFFERYLGDVTGASARGLAGRMRDAGMSLRNAGRELQGSDSAAARQAGKTIEALPDFLGWANGLVYPSYLGLPNLKAPLRNMTQPILKTVPEIGWANGSKWMFNGVTELLKDMKAARKDPFTFAEEYMQSKGLAGQHIMANLDEDPGLFSGAKGLADKLNAKSMWLYSKTDALNRALTYKMAEQWSKAVADGDAGALKALRRLGPGVRNELAASDLVRKAKQDPEAAGRLTHQLADYLIGRTQFRYGKELQSDFGRTMGPLFTMFTKWPTMITADVLDGFADGKAKGAAALASKYLGPWAVLYATQQAMTAANDDPSVAWKVYVGDLQTMAPLDTVVNPFKTVEGLGGPTVQVGREFLEGAARGDPSKLRAAGRSALKGYVPGVSNVLNELDRWSSAANPGEPTPSRDLINKLTGGQ